MLIICCGMNRAGSTVRYQIARHLVEKAGGTVLGWGWDNVKAKHSRSDGLFLAKVHERKDKIERKLRPAGTKYAYSYRDIRDVFASRKFFSGDSGPDEIRRIARELIDRDEHFRSRPNVLVSRYEDWLDDLEGEIERYEEFLGIPLTDEERADLADRLSIEKQKKYIEQLSDENMMDAEGRYRIDRETLLHKGHVRDGAAGKWRDVLTREQIDAIHEAAADWLVANGYEVPEEALSS